MNTPNHPFPDVPPENFDAIREALKAHGVTLSEVYYSVECTCEACGALWSSEASLDAPLSDGWWQCYVCYPKAEEERA